MYTAPVVYDAKAFANANFDIRSDFDRYWNDLPWTERGAPRREAFVATKPVDYTYGKSEYARTYSSSPIPEFMKEFWALAEEFSNAKFELCFCNGYIDEKNHLGWHADDSDSVDDVRPILVVSIGAEREIWFRDKARTFVDKLKLGNGSGLLMMAGMQDTHEHRIPKHSAKCGPRISFTFRGLVEA
jgi:alkylated DNA repair dioxygenase AlkB